MTISYTDIEFQSLLGFLMRCDLATVVSVIAMRYVSIPAGFSDALRRDHPDRDYMIMIMVSIPAGFSDALRLCL